MELIDKAAVVAEIERLYNRAERRVTLEKEGLKAEDTRKYEDGLADAYDIALSIIDSLEVKEMDFEKELDRIWFDNKLGNYFDNDALDFAHIRTMCKHFFELGLKTQKGETSDCFSKDDFIRKVYEWLKGYAFVDDENKVHLPTLLHDFLKDSRTI